MATTQEEMFTVLGSGVPVIRGIGPGGSTGPVRGSSTVEFGGDFQA